jgi:hypothetical protein
MTTRNLEKLGVVMANHSSELQEKQCNICGLVFPCTSEFFYKQQRGLFGFQSRCKKCHNKQTSVNSKRWREENPERHKANMTRWREENPERVKAQSREARIKYFEKNRARSQEWYRENKEAIKVHREEYRKRNPEIIQAARLRRRALRKSLPHTLTTQDWEYALSYFHNCCAVYGRQMNDMFGEFKSAGDHWIPLVKGGGTTPDNIVPLCHGLEGCNNKKRSALPQEWLEREYGVRKAKEILKKVSTFFSTVRKIGGSND